MTKEEEIQARYLKRITRKRKGADAIRAYDNMCKVRDLKKPVETWIGKTMDKRLAWSGDHSSCKAGRFPPENLTVKVHGKKYVTKGVK